MARWMLNLDGGPKRVNHAAVAIGDKIYSFGGYSATEGFSSDFIDVHCLNTFTYRWERLPIFPIETDEKKSRRSATISGPGPDEPSTSQSSRLCRRRAQSLDLDLHPLAQIRFSNPPLFEEEDEFMDQGIQSPSLEEPPMDANNQRQNLTSRIENVQAHQMDVSVEEREERVRYRELFSGIEARLMSSDEDDESEEDVDSDFQVSIDGSMDSLDTMEIETDNEEEEEDEPRMLVRVEGLGEIEVPAGIDLRELQKLQEHPEIPFKRYGHTVCEYKGQVYLWGGRNDKYGCRQTMHKYDPVQNRWSIVQTEGSCPPARDGHTAVIWGDHMYIFGGYEERELRFSQETYALHFPTGEWTKLKTQGDPPQYRDFHAASVIDGKMYVFGGRSDETGQSHTSHDVYDDQFRFLDLVSKKWHLLDVKGNHRPCGRRSHTMWTFGEKIFLFGGFHSIINNHFNDLWQFDPKKNEWSEITPNGQGPLPRRRQCTVPIGEKIFLFGGTMPNSRKRGSNALEDLGDLYVLSMVPPTLASLCLQTILQNEDLRKQAETVLPSILNRELFYMSTPNQQSKSSNRVGTNMRG